jgi:hypothetical protein
VIRYGPFVAPIDLDRLKAAPLAPLAEVPTVDVRGYLPATARIYKCPLHGTVWARPGVPPCDCDPHLDADP